MNGFVDGNIKSLRLENFQTFRRATFNFCCSFNFIAGPNGSGKSSIANALVLVFGGTPRMIGKAKMIGEYVRFGECEGSIEVVVCIDGGEMILKRLIGRDNKSRYFVNGNQCKKMEYDKIVSGFKGNVENLCQFLPQEKVSEFVRLTPEELLVETLSAVEESLVGELNGLVELEKEDTRVDGMIESYVKQKECVEGMIGDMNKDIERIKERDSKEERIRMMNEKKNWICYRTYIDIYHKNKKIVSGLKNDVEEKSMGMMNIDDKLMNLKNTGSYKELNDSCIVLDEYNEELFRLVNEFKRIQYENDMIEVDSRSLGSKKEKRQVGIDELRREIENLNDELSRITIPSYPNEYDESGIGVLEEKMSGLMRARGRIQHESSELKRQMEELNTKKRRFDEMREMRMDILKKYHIDTYKAVCWIKDNGDVFDDEVIEPPILHIRIKDERYTVEVENFLGFQSLSSFICKSSNDFEKLMRIMKDEKKWGINAIEVIRMDELHREVISREKLINLGFDGVLSDFIECRGEIMDYLAVVGHFDLVPIGKRSVDESVVFKETNVKRMAAGGRYIEIKRSRYDDSYVILDNPLKSRNLFSQNVSLKELNKISEELERKDEKRGMNEEELKNVLEEYEKVDKRLQMRYKERNVYNSQMMDIKKKEIQIQVVNESLCRKRSEMERLEDTHDLDCEKERIDVRRRGLEGEWNSRCEELNEYLNDEKYFSRFHESVRLNREVVNIKKNIELLEEERGVIDRRLNELESEIIERRKKNGKVKEMMEEKKRELEKIDRSGEYDMILEDLPKSIEDLDEEIVKERAQLMFYNVDIEVKGRYEVKEKDLNSLNEMISRYQDDLNGIRIRVNDIRIKLVERIEEMIGMIDVSFQDLFKRIGYEGKVLFVSDGLECSKWRLNVMVRFRSEENLEVLNSRRQSGGERSVSTIIFLLAIQNCRSSPFRLVDEINQGMDRHNEKLIHDTLVSLSDEGKTGQLFVITPKIVPDLVYSHNMKVIILYSFSGGETPDFSSYKSRILG